MKKKKICIITGSRAEWGLFYPLATEIKKNKAGFTLKIIATAQHFSKEFGSTYTEILEDGFKADYKVKVPLSVDKAEGVVKSAALLLMKLIKPLKSLSPDLVFLLGDRFETFAAATACLFLKIPIAHLHGGELTLGSLDDDMRHAITKMSSLHFTSTAAYRRRVMQMGETPDRVFNVGALGLDNITRADFLKKTELEKRLGFKFGHRNIMITFSPSTAEDRSIFIKQFKNLLEVVGRLEGVKVIFTKPNPDMYSSVIAKLIDNFVSKKRDKAVSFTSMGRGLYLSTLQFMDVVAGNSSSGIIEVPSFGIPAVNIGRRQQGRVRADSAIDADGSITSMRSAFKKAFAVDFRKRCKDTKNPYGDGRTAARIVKVIKKMNFSESEKRFFDLNLKK